MATASDRLANRVHATIGVIVARIKRQRITIEYPVSFYYATACTIVFLATCLPMGIGPAIAQWFVAPPGLRRLLDLAWWPGALLYVFGHTSCSHLAHNMAIFLVVAPPLESKLGWRTLASKIAITAVAGSLFNAACSDTGLVGASGVIFALCLLTPMVACADLRSNEVPACFVALAAVKLGGEVVQLASSGGDGISHAAHLVGGVCGSVLGFLGREGDHHNSRVEMRFWRWVERKWKRG